MSVLAQVPLPTESYQNGVSFKAIFLLLLIGSVTVLGLVQVPLPRTHNFKAAKERAIQVLNACPTEVIQRFINHLWRFIAAYEKGLTGKATAWAVKQQKTH